MNLLDEDPRKWSRRDKIYAAALMKNSKTRNVADWLMKNDYSCTAAMGSSRYEERRAVQTSSASSTQSSNKHALKAQRYSSQELVDDRCSTVLSYKDTPNIVITKLNISSEATMFSAMSISAEAEARNICSSESCCERESGSLKIVNQASEKTFDFETSVMNYCVINKSHGYIDCQHTEDDINDDDAVLEFVDSSTLDPDFDYEKAAEIASESSVEKSRGRHKKHGQNQSLCEATNRLTSLCKRPGSLIHSKSASDGQQNLSSKTNYCTFCGKGIQSKISRHLLTVHKNETRVLDILLLPKRCMHRMKLLNQLASEGNFKHNANILKCGTGEMVVSRRSNSRQLDPSTFLPCEFCKKFMKKRSLWRHCKVCKQRKENVASENEHKGGKQISPVSGGKTLLYSAVFDDKKGIFKQLLDRMRDDEVKQIVLGDELIHRFACLKLESLGRKEDQKLADIYRVSQSARLLGRIVLEARKTNENITLNDIISPEFFDLVVIVAKKMSTNKEIPALNVGRSIGLLLSHVALTKSGAALRESNEKDLEDATRFKKLHEAEWNFRVNSAAVKQMNSEKRMKTSAIPLTDDLLKLRSHVLNKIAELTKKVKEAKTSDEWILLAKFTMIRLILFNKRRRAEVKDLKLKDYLNRPKWWNNASGEMELALSPVDRILARRMDMVIAAGKSKKNIEAYVLLPPESQQAIDVLIETRSFVGVPSTNDYIFARLSSNTPMSGHVELQEIVSSCNGLQCPERITSRNLRKYIATVSQVMDLNETELGFLARHLGHDPKTHKEYYRLSHSTVELSKVSRLLLAVDKGLLHKFKGQNLSDINVEDLPDILDYDNDEDESAEIQPGQCSSLSNEADDKDNECTENPCLSLTDHSQHEREVKTRKDNCFSANAISNVDGDNNHSSSTSSTISLDKLNEQNEKTGSVVKYRKRRWTEKELRLLFQHFGKNITEKKMPNGEQIRKLVGIMGTRTAAQIRTQINNYVTGKVAK